MDHMDNHKWYSVHTGRRRGIRTLLLLVMVPALAAGMLFLVMGKWEKAGGHDSPSKTVQAGNGAAVSGQAGGANVEAEGPETSEAAFSSYEKTAPGVPRGEYTGPLQDIAFMAETSDSGSAFQRSIPVQIEAQILGGEKGKTCWAVFLPAEMKEHPYIVFSRYKEVTLEPLEEDERLAGGRLGQSWSADDSGKADASEGSRTYVSGDEASGLVNGSAFRVKMTTMVDNIETEDLYVFSCTGTATMYLDTESGSMATVDGDETKQTSEAAQYLVYNPDGSMDSIGTCSVSGRGNSTWHMKKRPYNVNLTEKKRVLGMEECKKLCLISNSFDTSNLLDRISAQLAESLGMRDTPDGEFVNLYLNGQYNGLYYLSQRVRTGGSVHIKKLDDKILEANGMSEEKSNVTLPERIALHEEGDRLKKWAYNWENEPKNNTGGYLLQMHERYNGDDCWFSTNHRRIRIMSPSYATKGEVEYLQEYLLEAEKAIYSEDGNNPDTGKPYSSYLDMNSWQDMFLLEETFVEWDAERWSFFMIKDRNDPLLYCGPMWDFDHSAGTMLYGDYPETSVSMLMFRDTRHGWMNELLSHEEFVDSLHARWQERFSPAVHSLLDEQLDREAAAIESSAYMNNIRRANDIDFTEDVEALRTWLTRRTEFLDSYTKNADAYCRVEFQFPWGNVSHYVLRGESLGYLPLPEYGENQIPSQVEKNEIIGWKDEDGREITADIVIEKDRVFSAIIRQ